MLVITSRPAEAVSSKPIGAASSQPLIFTKPQPNTLASQSFGAASPKKIAAISQGLNETYTKRTVVTTQPLLRDVSGQRLIF